MSAPAVITASVAAHEFDVPCQTSKCDCDSPAVAAVWIAHRVTGCPGDTRFCQEHLDAFVADYVEFLKQGRVCAVCYGPVTGTLESNLRVMPL